MSEPIDMRNANFASNSYVGFQAQTVHNGPMYQIAPEDPPEKQFEVGVRYLDGRMPGRALELIEKARTQGYLNSEVSFHWLLAFFSGRTIHQLDEAEVTRLEDARRWLRMDGADAWAEGLRAIDRLLHDSDNRGAGLKEFDNLGSVQRDKILRHLELLLKGTTRNALWAKAHSQAADEQRAAARVDRVWMFFEPKPAAPRPSYSEPVRTRRVDIGLAAVVTVLFAVSAGYLAVLTLQAARLSATVPLVASALGGYVCARAGVDWRFLSGRRSAKDRRYWPQQRPVPSGRPGGFVRQVDGYFDHYFWKYVPDGADRNNWIYWTSGIRWAMRDEIVELYREAPVKAPQIKWLVRTRVAFLARCWRDETLFAYRSQLRTPFRTAAALALGVVALAGGSVLIVIDVFPVRPLAAAAGVPLAVLTGWLAGWAWLRVVLERRRFDADQVEVEQQYRQDQEAFEKWEKKLARRPKDREMADWLECDRRVLMQLGLQHYKLLPSQVIAHAFIEGRAKSAAKRARERYGAWRYDRYSVRIFLLTHDGVRQMATEIDFVNGTFHGWERRNYRFDAIASVRVTESNNRRQIFELMLFNGAPITEEVVAPPTEELEPDADDASRMTLDAAGLTNTLHVLEGIAAEGREWAAHERSRGEHREAALRGLFDPPDSTLCEDLPR